MLDRFFKYEIQKNEDKIKLWCKDICYANFPLLHSLFDSYGKEKHRFILFSDHVENNMFIHSYMKVVILNTYCDAIQKWRILKNVIIRYIRKKRTSFSTTDFALNPLSQLKPYEMIDIMHNYKKYTFKILDLANIIFNALTNSDDYLFSTPLTIKNPYTNIKFSTEILYIIYFCMQKRGYVIHPLFTLFMKSKFNLGYFSLKYEGLVKEYIIDNKIKKYSDDKICSELKTMFTELTIYNPITMMYEGFFNNLDIPNHVLITFKPLLYHYFHSIYSMHSCYRHVEYNKLIKKIIAFKHQNPFFSNSFTITVPITKVAYKHITIPRRTHAGLGDVLDALMVMP